MAGQAQTKVSAAFAARLDRLKPDQRIRAVVLLDLGNGPPDRAGRRQPPGRRRHALSTVKEAAKQALPEIDRILGHCSGKRLAAEPNALGGIAVECTAAGIAQLAASDRVKAILEDQAISLLR